MRDAAYALVDEGFEVEEGCLGDGANLDLDDLVSRFREDTVVVAQMLVNNEFGSVYPIARLARLVGANAPQARLHVDAVQGLGKLDVSVGELGVHSLSISAHKIHGPKGSGALILRDGVRFATTGLRRRPGTQPALGHRERGRHRRTRGRGPGGGTRAHRERGAHAHAARTPA